MGDGLRVENVRPSLHPGESHVTWYPQAIPSRRSFAKFQSRQNREQSIKDSRPILGYRSVPHYCSRYDASTLRNRCLRGLRFLVAEHFFVDVAAKGFGRGEASVSGQAGSVLNLVRFVDEQCNRLR